MLCTATEHFAAAYVQCTELQATYMPIHVCSVQQLSKHFAAVHVFFCLKFQVRTCQVLGGAPRSPEGVPSAFRVVRPACGSTLDILSLTAAAVIDDTVAEVSSACASACLSMLLACMQACSCTDYTSECTKRSDSEPRPQCVVSMHACS